MSNAGESSNPVLSNPVTLNSYRYSHRVAKCHEWPRSVDFHTSQTAWGRGPETGYVSGGGTAQPVIRVLTGLLDRGLPKT